MLHPHGAAWWGSVYKGNNLLYICTYACMYVRSVQHIRTCVLPRSLEHAGQRDLADRSRGSDGKKKSRCDRIGRHILHDGKDKPLSFGRCCPVLMKGGGNWKQLSLCALVVLFLKEKKKIKR